MPSDRDVRETEGGPVFGCVATDVPSLRRTEAALVRQNAILEAVGHAAERLLSGSAWREEIPEVLARLGRAAGVSRAYIFENHTNPDGTLLTSQRFEWAASGIPGQMDNPDLQAFPYRAGGFGRWVDAMSRRVILHGNVRDFPEPERTVLEPQGILSLAAVPIFAGRDWWGFIGFDECAAEREWSVLEMEALRAAANTLGAAIRREEDEKDLRRSETLLRSVSDASPLALYVVDTATDTILHFNRRFLEIWGLAHLEGRMRRGEIRNGDLIPHCLPLVRDVPSFTESCQSVRSDEEAAVREDEIAFADGRTIRRFATRIPNGEECCFGRLYLFEDITDRKRAEEALQASEERFRTSIENMIDAFAIFSAIRDEAGRIVDFQFEYVNEAGCRTIGMGREEIIGRTMLGLLPAHRTSGLLGKYVRLVETGEPFQAEAFIYEDTVGGRKRIRGFFDIRAHRLGDGFAMAWGDVTEHVVAQAALKESEERFRSLVTNALVGFFIVQEGQVVFLNPAQERLFGTVPKSLRLGDFASVHPEDRERFLALAGTAGDRTAAEIRFLIPGDGESGSRTQWASGRASPVVWHGQNAVLVNMVDVTDAKEFERMALVQQKMASLGQVAAGIAHEIRNPLSGLNIHLSALERVLEESEGLEEEVRETVRTVLGMAGSASNKIEGVIRRVMDFVRHAPRRMEPLAVNGCVREALDLTRTTLQRSGIRLDVSLREDLPPCRGDARLLEQVLLNLLTNAVQAMEGQDGEKRIEIGCAEENGSVLIRVADSGPGVPEAIREKVFDPFFTTRRKGTGIGLSITHRIVTDHRGFIKVGTSRFGGALFTIGLPACGDPKSL